MENLVRTIKPKQVMISVLGVREGLLYSLLNARERARDPLISAAADLNVLRSRSPHHGEELIDWTDRFMASSGLKRLRTSAGCGMPPACLADIGWRAHPDYRGEQSMNIIANGRFRGDRPSWPRLSRAVGVLSPRRLERGGPVAAAARTRDDTRMLDRARVVWRCHASRLYPDGWAGRGASKNTDASQTRQAHSQTAGCIRRACKRSAGQPIATIGTAGRPRVDDRDVIPPDGA